MKYILILSLCLVGCQFPDEPPESGPKFVKDQKIHYKVPHFYSSVCSGKGIVKDMKQIYGGYLYEVRTPTDETDCPLNIWVEENEMGV